MIRRLKSALMFTVIVSGFSLSASYCAQRKSGGSEKVSEAMVVSQFGQKLWSVIGGSPSDVKQAFGEPKLKDKCGSGYAIPGFVNQDETDKRLSNFFNSKELGNSVSIMLPMCDLGELRAEKVFKKMGWDIKKWKSVDKKMKDSDYSERL